MKTSRQAATPETQYEFIRGWFIRAAKNASAARRLDSAKLWDDGLQHLDAFKAQRDELLKALKEAEDALARCYEVTEWPANGDSSQDHALATVRAARAKAEGKS